MIKILEETKANLIALEVRGKLTREDYDVFNPRMEKTIKNYEKPRMYCEVYDIDLPEMQAMWEEIKNIPDYNKFDRCAIVSTEEWIEAMTKIADKPMSPRVKHFNYDQKAEAMQWLQEPV